MPTGSIRRVAALSHVLLLSASLAACVPEAPRGPATEASAEIGEDGATLTLDSGVTVIAPSGTAPAGTQITASLTSPTVPHDFSSFASPEGHGVTVELEGGRQPSKAISIEFQLPDDIDDPSTLFVMAEADESDRGAEFVESEWDAETSTLTATAEHLSWYTVTRIDKANLGTQFGDWIAAAGGTRTTKPACVDEPVGPSGSFVLASPWPQSAWVCAKESSDGVTVTLQSNSGLVFELLSEPAGEYGPVTGLTPAQLIAAYLARQLLDNGGLDGDSVLLSGGEQTIMFQRPFESARIAMRVEPGLTQIATLDFGLRMLLPARWVELLDWESCAAEVIGTISGGTAEAFKAIVSCLATGIGGIAGGLLGIIASAPGLLQTQLEGLYREVSQTNVEQFDVYLVASDAVREKPEEAQWLWELESDGDSTSGEEDMAEIPTTGGTVTYPFSTNQWVGCDTVAGTDYRLNGEWSSLSLAIGLQDHTPDDLVATFTVFADGTAIYSTTIGVGQPVDRIDLDVADVQTLTVEATTQSDCASANEGYASLVQSYVEP